MGKFNAEPPRDHLGEMFSSRAINAERWGFGGPSPLPEEPSVESMDRKPRPPQIRGFDVHEKLSDKKRLQLVKRLVADTPNGFACKEACGKCCEQPLDVLWGEWEKLEGREDVKAILLEHTANGDQVQVVPKTPAAAMVGLADTGHCPFLHPTTKACRIYDARPFSCRAYGQHWFARCAAGVEAPVELDVSDKGMRDYGRLARLPFGAMPLERWAPTREVVEQWRKLEDVEARRDQMPTFEEVVRVADRLLDATPVESVARKRLEGELAHLRAEVEAKKAVPENEKPAPL